MAESTQCCRWDIQSLSIEGCTRNYQSREYVVLKPNLKYFSETWILPSAVLLASVAYAVLAFVFYNNSGWFHFFYASPKQYSTRDKIFDVCFCTQCSMFNVQCSIKVIFLTIKTEESAGSMLFQSQNWNISQRPGSCLLPSFLLWWPMQFSPLSSTTEMADFNSFVSVKAMISKLFQQ